jgi:hypothetical protein
LPARAGANVARMTPKVPFQPMRRLYPDAYADTPGHDE